MKNLKWYHVVIIGLVVLLFVSFACGKGGMKGFFCGGGRDTISHTIDTVITHDTSTVVFIPVPVNVTAPGEVRWLEKVKHDTLPPLIDYRYAQPCDSTYTKAYFMTSYYDTTLTGTRWKARVKNTVTQNRITESSLTVNTSDTLIKEVITLRQPKKLIVYYGLSGMGKVSDPLYGAGLSLGLKGRNDNMFLATATLSRNGMIYQGHAMFPIRLFKRK